jgi:glycosyltransferase involved in cell wall biosynthesis
LTESRNTPGASGARNWGVSQAHGKRVLFLDDDDILCPGYAAWVIEQLGDYGFSEISRFSGMQYPNRAAFQPAAVQLVSEMRPFRRRLAGLGCGFWIDRSTFLSLGGISEELRVNEDTEFSIRALRAGLRGIYSSVPGVMVRRHASGHLTQAQNPRERAENFTTILERHADWLAQKTETRRHLMLRRIKLLAHAKDQNAATQAIAQANNVWARSQLRLVYALTRLSDRLRNR